VVAALLPGAAATAASCQRGVSLRLAEVPRGATDPRAAVYIVDHVKPGASFTRRLEACNGTAQSIRLRFYPNAAVVENGKFTIVEGHAANELTSWVSVAPTEAVLRPGEALSIRARIAVPPGVAGGERYGVVLAELPAERRSDNVAVASRVGVRLYLDVGGPKAPVSDFRVDSLQASRDAAGSPLVTAQVHNTGNRALDITGDLALRNGPGGLSGGPFPAQLGTTLAPGDTEPVRVPLSTAIRGGPWTARLTLRSGLLTRKAEALLTFPDAAGQAEPPVKATNIPLAQDKRVLVPLAIGLIGIVLLFLFFLWLFAKLRSKRRQTDDDVDARRAAQ
jgi:hypothetical protein